MRTRFTRRACLAQSFDRTQNVRQTGLYLQVVGRKVDSTKKPNSCD